MADALDDLEMEMTADLLRRGGYNCEHPTHDIEVFAANHAGRGRYLVQGQCTNCNDKGPVFWICEKFYLSGMAGQVTTECYTCKVGQQEFRNYYRLKGRWSPNGPVYA